MPLARTSTACSARCCSAARRASSRPKRCRAAKRRACCSAGMMLQKPNVLVLDEPTNHLDLESINALNIALQKFEGTVFLVTHDEDLMDEVGTRVWHFEPATHRRTSRGHYEEYAASIARVLSSCRGRGRSEDTCRRSGLKTPAPTSDLHVERHQSDDLERDPRAPSWTFSSRTATASCRVRRSCRATIRRCSSPTPG